MTLARRLGAAHVVGGEPRRLGMPDAVSVPVVIPDPLAVAEGFEQGFAAGREAAAAERQAAMAALDEQHVRSVRESTEALEAQRLTYLEACARLAREVEDDRLWAEGLAVEIAHAALARWWGEHATDAAWVERCCAQLMRELPHMRYSLRVAVDDAERVAQASPGVDVQADASLDAGELIVETPRGDFDVGIAQRMDTLRKTLLASLSRRRKP